LPLQVLPKIASAHEIAARVCCTVASYTFIVPEENNISDGVSMFENTLIKDQTVKTLMLCAL